MATIRHLNVIDIVALHAIVMEQTGFPSAPLLREAVLESAVMRTRMAEIYAHTSDLVRLAALLAVGISQAQAFLEGNKRTAYIAADAFLRVNAMEFSGDPLDMSTQLNRLADRTNERERAEDDFTEWLRENVQPHTAESV